MKVKVRKRKPAPVKMEQANKIDKDVMPVINIDMGCMMRNATKKVDKGNC